MVTLFKNTTLGQIPEEWYLCQIKDIAQINAGQSPNSFDCNDEGKGIPFFQGNADFGYKYPRISSWTTKPTKIAQRNDILMSVRAPVGEINFADTKCCIGRGLCAITPKSRVNLHFLYYMLISSMPRLLRFQQGSTFLAVSRENIDMHFIPLPPLPEQCKIAEILSTVDDAIEKTDAIIREIQQLKKGLMQKLFTEGIGHTRFKKTILADVTERIIVGLATSVTKHYRPKGIPIIRNLNILRDKFDDSDILYLDPGFTDMFQNKEVKSNDVLTVHTGNVGISCLVPEKYVGAQTFTTLITTTKRTTLLPKYLCYHLNSNIGQNEIIRIQVGGGRNNLNVADFLRYRISVPPINEQNKIAEILSTVDTKIETEQAFKEELEQLKNGLMQVLLTGKLRAKV